MRCVKAAVCEMNIRGAVLDQTSNQTSNQTWNGQLKRLKSTPSQILDIESLPDSYDQEENH